MKPIQLFFGVLAALFILGSGVVKASQTIDKVGALVCVIDKWNESEPDKGHKLVEYAGRCVTSPTNPRPHR